MSIDEDADQKNRLTFALKKLPPEQQELIQLSRFEGLKYSEVAEILDISVSNIKTRMHRTMKTLRINYFNIGEI